MLHNYFIVAFAGRGAMFWTGIRIGGRTTYHVHLDGTITGQRYIREVLETYVRLSREAVGGNFIFMVDNACTSSFSRTLQEPVVAATQEGDNLPQKAIALLAASEGEYRLAS